MPTLTLHPMTPAHLDDHMASTSVIPPRVVQSTLAGISETPAPSTVAISFAFDNTHKTLSVTLTNAGSGEVLRTMAYTHISQDVHKTDQLSGLLLNQWV